MRFNSVDEVKAWAFKAAASDIARGVLNPFCTDGARNMWQRGFDNAPPYSWEHDLNWDTMYQRGRATATLLKETT